MRTLSCGLLVLVALNASALPNFDPFADATASSGTSYTIGSGLAPNNDGGANNWQLVGSNNAARRNRPLSQATSTTPIYPRHGETALLLRPVRAPRARRRACDSPPIALGRA